MDIRILKSMTQFEPHEYQKKAIQFALDRKRCGLFLPMGAGKTVTTLTIIRTLIAFGDVKRVLIIGPVRVIQSTWPDEIQKWEHTKELTYSVISGTPKQRRRALEQKADIYLIGKENVSWLIDETNQFKFDMVVIDELSTFKNPKSLRFKALRRAMPTVDRFIGLTGTPAPRGIPDLWSQVYLMDRGERLGKSLTVFRERFLMPGRRNGYIVYEWLPQPDAERRIYKAIGDICMSLDQNDCTELPPVNYIDVKVKLPKKAESDYRAFKRDKVLSIKDDTVMAANAGVLCNQLKQMTSGEIYRIDPLTKQHKGTAVVHSAKLEALEDLIESANGQPVMVFYYYQHERDRILEHFKDRAVRELKEAQDIADWNKGKIEVLLVHPASAGHGLNLQNGGHIAVWYSLPNWNLELYQQANARIYRQGQKQNVTIYRILAEGTIDEDEAQALEKKDVTQQALIKALRR